MKATPLVLVAAMVAAQLGIVSAQLKSCPKDHFLETTMATSRTMAVEQCHHCPAGKHSPGGFRTWCHTTQNEEWAECQRIGCESVWEPTHCHKHTSSNPKKDLHDGTPIILRHTPQKTHVDQNGISHSHFCDANDGEAAPDRVVAQL